MSMISLEALADLIGRRVRLRQVGDRYVGRCPFGRHVDRRPSFNLFEGRDGKPRYKCLACAARGDLHDWLRFIGEPVAFVPDPELVQQRLARKAREAAIAAWRDQHPDAMPEEERFLFVKGESNG